jgi:hypothetical protein
MSNSKGLYLKYEENYIVACPYNLLKAAKVPGDKLTATARNYLASLVPGVDNHERGDIARFVSVRRWKVAHEVGQFYDPAELDPSHPNYLRRVKHYKLA